MRLSVTQLSGHEAANNLAAEEERFRSLGPEEARLLFYVNSPCIVLGRSNRAEEWVNLATAEADGVPVLRRFSGGGTVYHDLDNLNFSLMLPRPWLANAMNTLGLPLSIGGYIAYFRRLLLGAFADCAAGDWAESGTSDITLNGRKVSGNAQRVSARSVLHHGTLMLRCPLAAIERYLLQPPNRPQVAHRDFVTGLTEEGQHCSMAQLQASIEAHMRRALGLPAA